MCFFPGTIKKRKGVKQLLISLNNHFFSYLISVPAGTPPIRLCAEKQTNQSVVTVVDTTDVEKDIVYIYKMIMTTLTAETRFFNFKCFSIIRETI